MLTVFRVARVGRGVPLRGSTSNTDTSQTEHGQQGRLRHGQRGTRHGRHGPGKDANKTQAARTDEAESTEYRRRGRCSVCVTVYVGGGAEDGSKLLRVGRCSCLPIGVCRLGGGRLGGGRVFEGVLQNTPPCRSVLPLPCWLSLAVSVGRAVFRRISIPDFQIS